MHLLIVTADFYPDLSRALLQGAKAALKKAGATADMVRVPGALEITAAINFAIRSRKYDGYVALGCVIRGETYHFEIVCEESARGLTWLAIDKEVPIGNGILTVENEKQAWVRADPKRGNKGGHAAQAALALIALKKEFSKKKKKRKKR